MMQSSLQFCRQNNPAAREWARASWFRDAATPDELYLVHTGTVNAYVAQQLLRLAPLRELGALGLAAWTDALPPAPAQSLEALAHVLARAVAATPRKSAVEAAPSPPAQRRRLLACARSPAGGSSFFEPPPSSLPPASRLLGPQRVTQPCAVPRGQPAARPLTFDPGPAAHEAGEPRFDPRPWRRHGIDHAADANPHVLF